MLYVYATEPLELMRSTVASLDVTDTRRWAELIDCTLMVS